MEFIFFEDIVEVRMNIEFFIVCFVVLRVMEEDIKDLCVMIDKMEEEMNVGIYVSEIDEVLYNGIVKVFYNDLFISIMVVISNVMKQQEMWKFIRDRIVIRFDYREVNFNEYKLFISVIEKYDEEEVVRIMNFYMGNLYDCYWKG